MVVEKPAVAAAFAKLEQNAHRWCSATATYVCSSTGAAFIGRACTCTAAADNNVVCPDGFFCCSTASRQRCRTAANCCWNSCRFSGDCTKDGTHYAADLTPCCCKHELSPTAVVIGPSNRRFRYTFWATCLFVDPLWAWNFRMESCMNAKLCGNNCGTSSWRGCYM